MKRKLASFNNNLYYEHNFYAFKLLFQMYVWGCTWFVIDQSILLFQKCLEASFSPN